MAFGIHNNNIIHTHWSGGSCVMCQYMVELYFLQPVLERPSYFQALELLLETLQPNKSK